MMLAGAVMARRRTYRVLVIFLALIGDVPLARCEPEAWVLTLAPGATNVVVDARQGGLPSLVWEDQSGHGRPITNVVVGGIRLGHRVLSGSRFSLHPDRLGSWTYDFGYRAFPPEMAAAPMEEVRELFMTEYPWVRLQHDPEKAPGVELRSSYQPRMWLSPRHPELVYALDFGDFEAVALAFRPWGEHPVDDTGGSGTYRWMRDQEAYTLAVTVSTDPEGRQVVAEQVWDETELGGKSNRLTATLTLPGLSRFYVRLTLRQGSVIYLAGGGMGAWLRFAGEDWPVLARGANTLAYHEHDAPAEGTRHLQLAVHAHGVWPGFAGDLEALGFSARCRAERVPADKTESPYQKGVGVLRLSGGDDVPENWAIMFDVPPTHRDWSGIKAVSVTYRVPGWCGNLYATGRGGADASAAGSLLALPSPPFIQPRNGSPMWQTATLALSADPGERGHVTRFGLRAWGGTWQRASRQGADPFRIEIAAIDLIPFAPGEVQAQEARRAREVAWDAANADSALLSRLRAMPLPDGPHRPPASVLARGIWGFPLTHTRFREASEVRDIWELRERMLDDLKANHCNAIHVYADQVSTEEFGEFVKLAESKGISIWGVFAYARQVVHLEPAARAATWSRVLDQASRYFEAYRDTPTILAWAIDEEPGMEALPLLADCRRRLHEIGAQPHIMIYNQANVMAEDAITEPFPGGVAMDCYPFYRFSTVTDRYLDYLQATREAANASGGVAWFVPQMHGTSKAWVVPGPAEMRFQVWTGLAWGITGFFPWPYHAAKNDDMSNTPQFDHYAEEMRKVALLEPLLLDAEHEQTTRSRLGAAGVEFLIGRFRSRRDPQRRYVLMVNLDLNEAHSVTPVEIGVGEEAVLAITEENQLRGRELAMDDHVPFAPGEGRILVYTMGRDDEADD